MFRNLRNPVLHLIVCGAQSAGELEPFVKTCQEQGWDVWIVPTPAAAAFVNSDALAELTGHPVRVDYPPPNEPDDPPPAGAVAVVPATFNTINKLAYGTSDSFALGLVHEAIGLGVPILAMPALDPALSRHPVFAESVNRLRTWGVSVLFHRTYLPSAAATGGTPGEDLPWHAAEELLGGWIRFARITPLAQAG
ncbi:MAG TPA: flavoprotein [Micromonosporaceae bacterium]